MEKQMIAELDVRCPPQDAERRIRQMFSREQRFELEVPFGKIGLPDMGKFSRHVTFSLGTSFRRTDGATMVPLRWRDARSKNFPEFEGYFEISELAKDCVQVAILGDYLPPGGPLGAAFDAAIGKHVAEVTVDELLHRLRVELEKT